MFPFMFLYIKQKIRTFGPFFLQIRFFHLYFGKKKHKYYTMHGAIYGNIGGEKHGRRRMGMGR